ncbi:hypothetical protein QOZ80_3BG0260910 [Eleusine coracana subsp. coracana]|nr:hypothetical protein QOZ80_3BG0260910 [Eleusine coracana subsp. coracana]
MRTETWEVWQSFMEKGEDVSVAAHWDVVSEDHQTEKEHIASSFDSFGLQTKTMMNVNRQFLNLVVADNFIRTGVHSLRRIKVADHLFYPSTSAAETAMAETAAAIKANAEFQAGYKDGMRTLCVDSSGHTSLYDADTHSVLTMPSLGASKGHDAIPISVFRAADGRGKEHDRLYVLTRSRTSPELSQYAFEELSYGDQDMFASYEGMIHEWTPLPPPPFMYINYPSEDDIGAYTVVDGSIYFSSSTKQGFGTYYFDTEHWKWWRAGKWLLPFSGKAEYVPDLDLWFGLSSSHPFHLCASDLSPMDIQRPPTVAHSWVDLDMPKKWSPHRMDLIDLG